MNQLWTQQLTSLKETLLHSFCLGLRFGLVFFANSPNPNYQKLSQKFVIAKDWDEYYDMVGKVISTGLYADMGVEPLCFNWNNCAEEFKDWYRSTERISGFSPYSVHLSNKKWPLKKVL